MLDGTLLFQPAPQRKGVRSGSRLCEPNTRAVAIPAGAAHHCAQSPGAAFCKSAMRIRPSQDFCLPICIFVRGL
jgi:hypothetical protein